MANENKIYITAPEMAALLGVSVGHAYKMVREMNKELEKSGYMVIAGKVSRAYFEEKIYGLQGGSRASTRNLTDLP